MRKEDYREWALTFAQIAEENPAAAILASWNYLEAGLAKFAVKPPDDLRTHWTEKFASHLVQNYGLQPHAVEVIRLVKNVRDQVLHGALEKDNAAARDIVFIAAIIREKIDEAMTKFEADATGK
ncbi:MAG: hypothetical protein U0R49_04715 [Fimbriimonadales bacterium]